MKGLEQNSKNQTDVGQFLRMSKRQNRRNAIDVDVGEFLRIAEGKSTRINKKNVYEIKDKMKDSKGFDLIGNITINGIKRKTNMRFRSIKDFESYIEKIDDNYDGEDVIFEGQSIEYDVPDCKPVKRSIYGKGTNYLSDIAEYRNNCFIPTGNNCFLKCFNYLTDKDYKKE